MMNIKNLSWLFILFSLVAYEEQPCHYKPSFKASIKAPAPAQVSRKVPVVYHPRYNISLVWGLERIVHPFDGCKYEKIAAHLQKVFGLSEGSFYKPEKVSEDDLKQVHSEPYLESLKNSCVIAGIAEINMLKWLPNSFLQSKILDPMRYATQGTIDAVQLALTNGIAFNLSGGYHHARFENQRGGFCFFADIPLAIRKVREQNPSCRKILVVDLDAHRGNGVAQVRYITKDTNTIIFDMFSSPNYPGDRDMECFNAGDRAIPLENDIKDDEYLAKLEKELAPLVDRVKPDLIIFNAGSDIYEGDKLGRMNVSSKGIIKRDALVFEVARSRNIPIAMMLSGGYSPESADIVARSIESLLRTYGEPK